VPQANYLRFRLGPKQVAIALGAQVKRHGTENVGDAVELFACNTQDDEMEAYERLLGDALKGDTALFGREDAVDATWRIVDPILTSTTSVHAYAPGSWGPAEADALVAPYGGWRNPPGVK
jgi:glucose-6-phosphate 1-dehydrogenase